MSENSNRSGDKEALQESWTELIRQQQAFGEQLKALAKQLPGYTDERRWVLAFMVFFASEYGWGPEQVKKLTATQMHMYATAYLSKNGKEKNAATGAAEVEALTGAERDKAFQALEPAAHKAYLSHQYAESKKEIKLEDSEAYELLKEEGITDTGHPGQLIDYELPIFASWSRQLRTARNALQEQKHKRRGRPSTSKSIVKGSQIEYQKGGD